MYKKMFLAILSLILICSMGVNLTGCTTKVQATDLMEGVQPNTVTGKAADDAFAQSQMRLAVELFQSSVLESKDENVLISPLSIQLALAMTANGADGNTKAEMEALLGGEISLEDLNEYLYSYVNNLPSAEKYKLQIANSIWFRDDEGRLQVEKAFLQKNADYYRAQAYKAAYAEWQHVYDKSDVYKGKFTNIGGTEKQVDMMHSEESVYLQDKNAIGFTKPYSGSKYNFAVLLPNEGVDIYEYIAGLTGEELMETLSTPQLGMVMATLPKFSYEYELTMNDVLKELGMPSAFSGDTADFSKMAHSSRGNIYIGDVLHKTFISVDELGTKAGAVTKVQMNDESAPMSEWVVTLNRPFVYMIIDNETKLPIFIGTVMDITN